ncbi:unnamed protein product [Acanthoscelides obtectus]|uniref:Uncharacterized protein n=1 Tax=Acanthoscelides obtectus TaxID=200917 RepID=A0A9P0K9C8_ACAOB|nr:unnamed protein product [Acanthoscelides obtectus]CAK1633550.1 hypothetical protein AOBTE_LOCUS8217 [Acanthoscelides obtectus]
MRYLSYLFDDDVDQETKVKIVANLAKTVHRPTVNATFHRNLNFLVQFMINISMTLFQSKASPCSVDSKLMTVFSTNIQLHGHIMSLFSTLRIRCIH